MSMQRSNPTPSLSPHIVNLQGRAYSTWAGTLDTAHAANQSELVRFLGIETTIVQLPSPENGGRCVVHARAKWRNADGDAVAFDGIGDADPQNTKSHIAAHLIRMAETRAKGRALRDSVNIGEVLEEELGDETPPQRQAAQAQQQAAPAVRQPTQATTQRAPQTNADAEAAALLTQQNRLFNATQSDREGKALLLAYLKQQGKTRISEMDMAEVTEWLLVLYDREATPDMAAAGGRA